MKRLMALGIFAVLMTFSAISSAQTIFQKEDKFDGDVHYFTPLREADLEGGSFFSRRYVYLQLHAFKNLADTTKPYVLRINTSTPDWIFIKNGASLTLKIDGSKMLELSNQRGTNNREVMSGNNVAESASYFLSLDELRLIAQAKTVDFRIFGDRQLITGTFKSDFLEDAANFVEQGPKLLGILGISPATERIPTTGTLTKQPPKFGINYILVSGAVATAFSLPEA